MGTEKKKLNGTHKKTLADIFTEPTPVGILFNAVVSLLEALGWSVRSGKSGSHYKAYHDERQGVLIIPKPHGGKKSLPAYVIRKIRDALAKLGFAPGE